MSKSKFQYKNFAQKGKGLYLHVSSERAVFRAVGKWHKSRQGNIVVPIEILRGVFTDFEGKEYNSGTGNLVNTGRSRRRRKIHGSIRGWENNWNFMRHRV